MVAASWSSPYFFKPAIASHCRGAQPLGASHCWPVVTSVLASYRGYDTLGETVVIFTAGIGVLLLLKRSPRRDRDDAEA